MSATPFLVGAIVGIMSALLTILITPNLQHYFWRRQRHAEWQFAMIEELNMLIAAMEPRLAGLVSGVMGQEERQTYQEMVGLLANIRALFFPLASERCQALHQAIRAGWSATDPELRGRMRQHIQEIHQDALRALYQDMGIPPTPPGQ
jgi:hypothetical protein